jgi:hypothetical protein
MDPQLVVRKLLEYDPGIVEIVQFGSSVYAPRHARDIDLLVVTGKMKEYSGYLDAVADFNVDVLVFEVGKIPGEGLLRGVLGSFRLLYGDGRFLLGYARLLGDPSFEEARASLRAALDYFELSKRTGDSLVKERHVREAFDALFHAARIASMVYLSTDVGRWGLVRRKLEEPYRTTFNVFIETLHIKYFYNGEYPREGLEEEFNKWYRKVEEYISSLESKVRSK